MLPRGVPGELAAPGDAAAAVDGERASGDERAMTGTPAEEEGEAGEAA